MSSKKVSAKSFDVEVKQMSLSTPPSEKELEEIEQLRKDIQPLIDSYKGEIHPEMFHEFKLLRYVRGHRKDAVTAVQAHLNFRIEKKIDEVRAMLLAEEEKTGTLVWPYFLDEFQPLLNGVWDGVAPAVHHGYSPFDHSPMTFTVIANYNFDKIFAEKLENLWLYMVLCCDVYFDLILHRKSIEQNTPVMRHDIVDVAGLKMSDMGRKAIGLLKDMGQSAEQYPEMIGKTTACNVSTIGVNIWNMAKGFLPKQTAEKMSIHTDDFLDGLKTTGLELTNLPKRINGECECDQCIFHINRSNHVVSVKKGATHESNFPKVKPGDELHWEVLEMSGKLERQIWLSDEKEKNKVVFQTNDEMKGIYKITAESEMTFALKNDKGVFGSKTATISVFIKHKEIVDQE